MRNWNETIFLRHPPGCRVITLPMRNWNRPKPWGCPSSSHVITLPMRNWNLFQVLQLSIVVIELLHYLWGIETRFTWNKEKLIYSSYYITYEELKRGLPLRTGLRCSRLLHYLWGIETMEGSHAGLVEVRYYITYEELKHRKSFRNHA